MLTIAEFLALSADERAAHIATLTGEQLAELEAGLRDHFTELHTSGDLSDDALAAMEACADARDAVVARQTELAAEVEQAEARAAELAARMTPPAPTGEGDGDPAGDPAGDAPADGDPAGDAPAGDPAGDAPDGDPAPGSPEAVAAAAARPRPAPLQRMAARQPARAQARPTLPEPHRVQFRASDGVPSHRAGVVLDARAIGEAMSEVLRLTDGATGRFSVATADWSGMYPEDRRLRRGDQVGNDNRIDAATSREALVAAAEAFMAGNPSDMEALVAAGGGFCAPFPIDYDVPVEGSLARPVRDALARFGADRGGIQFTPPPVLPTAAAAGVGVWDAADDEAVTLNADGTYTPGGGGAKPIVEFDCLDGVTEEVEAITQRASFSNFNARFAPEQVAAHARLALVAQARFAEIRLLGKLWDRADFRVTTAQVLGAARDYFAMLDTLLPAIRYRRRLDVDQPMRVIAPAWVRDLFRADFVRQMPTDDTATAMAIADATILAWARARRCNLSFALDDRNGAATYDRAQPTIAQDGTVPGGGAALLDFPDTVESVVFPEGAVQFLDGGGLDLGVQRDSRTNAVNRYETFTETFEGVAKRGTPLYVVQSTLQPTGSASALTSINATDL